MSQGQGQQIKFRVIFITCKYHIHSNASTFPCRYRFSLIDSYISCADPYAFSSRSPVKAEQYDKLIIIKDQIETGDLRSLWYKWSISIAKDGISMYNTSNEKDHLSFSTAEFIF